MNLYNYFSNSLTFQLDSNTITQYLIKVKEKETTINEFHSNDVSSVIHIPNTKFIVSGSYDKTIKIWNYET